MSYIRCAYHNCDQTSRNISMFRFPVHDKERLTLWIRNSGNLVLDGLTTEKLIRRHICAKHFLPKNIHHGAQRSRLVGPAFPIHFESDSNKEQKVELDSIRSENRPERDDHSSKPENSPERDYYSSRSENSPERDDHSSKSENSPERDYHSSRSENSPERDDHSSKSENSPERDYHSSRSENSPERDDHSSKSENSPEREVEDKDPPVPVPPCSQCSNEITGFAFLCVQCEVRVCGACDARGLHARHYVLRAPPASGEAELTEVFGTVRKTISTAGVELFPPPSQPAQDTSKEVEDEQNDHSDAELELEPEIKYEVIADEEDPLGSLEYDDTFRSVEPEPGCSQVDPESKEIETKPEDSSTPTYGSVLPVNSPRSLTRQTSAASVTDSDDFQPLFKRKHVSEDNLGDTYTKPTLRTYSRRPFKRNHPQTIQMRTQVLNLLQRP